MEGREEKRKGKQEKDGLKLRIYWNLYLIFFGRTEIY